jgi:hypothetical protein
MTTAQDIINSSASDTGLLAEGQALENGINRQCLRLLNRMIQRWRNSGVDLGLPEVLLADTVFVDVADEESIEVNLTLRLMVRFKRPIPPGLSAAGDSAFDELQAKYMIINEMRLDNALTQKYLPRKRPAERLA